MRLLRFLRYHLGKRNKLPSDGPSIVWRHRIAFGNRSRGRRIAYDLPYAGDGALLSCSSCHNSPHIGKYVAHHQLQALDFSPGTCILRLLTKHTGEFPRGRSRVTTMCSARPILTISPTSKKVKRLLLFFFLILLKVED